MDSIQCACGCGIPRSRLDKKGRLRQYIHGHWRRGRHGKITMHSDGYVYLILPGYPNADRHGYILEHRVVMERMIGRSLLETEHVHHKNGIQSDNRPENLELMISESLHGSIHAKSKLRDEFGRFTV